MTDDRLTRRRALALGGLTLATVTAGCQVGSDGGPTGELPALAVGCPGPRLGLDIHGKSTIESLLLEPTVKLQNLFDQRKAELRIIQRKRIGISRGSTDKTRTRTGAELDGCPAAAAADDPTKFRTDHR